MAKEDKTAQPTEPSIANMSQEDYAKLRNAEAEPTAEPSPTKTESNLADDPSQSDGSSDQSDTSTNQDQYDKFSKRLDRLNRRAERERQARVKAEQQLEEFRKQQTQAAEPATEAAKTEDKPDTPMAYPEPEDYDTTDDYVNALEKWSDAQDWVDDGDDDSASDLNNAATDQSEPEIKPSSEPKVKTTWDDLVDIIDESEAAPDTMVSDLADLMRKGEINLNEEMADWLVVNEESAVDVLQKFIDKPRLARRISKLPKSQMKRQLQEVADMEDAVPTVQNYTGIAEVRGTAGGEVAIDVANMSQEEYKRMRFLEDNPHLAR